MLEGPSPTPSSVPIRYYITSCASDDTLFMSILTDEFRAFERDTLYQGIYRECASCESPGNIPLGNLEMSGI